MQYLIGNRTNHAWLSEVCYMKFVKYDEEFQGVKIMLLQTGEKSEVIVKGKLRTSINRLLLLYYYTIRLNLIT